VARPGPKVKLRSPARSRYVVGMHFGAGEIIMIVIIVMIVFSASRMSALGNAVGRFVYSFRKASQGEPFVEGTATKKLERATEDAAIIDQQTKS
jgi:sec-independent protein translocase protein TatA